MEEIWRLKIAKTSTYKGTKPGVLLKEWIGVDVSDLRISNDHHVLYRGLILVNVTTISWIIGHCTTRRGGAGQSHLLT